MSSVSSVFSSSIGISVLSGWYPGSGIQTREVVFVPCPASSRCSPARTLALSDDEEGIEIKGFIIHTVMMSELVNSMMYRFDRGNKSPLLLKHLKFEVNATGPGITS